jgi:hypothetical protein
VLVFIDAVKFGAPALEPAGEVGWVVDVSGRPEVVAGNGECGEAAGPLVGHAMPYAASEQDRMTARPSVRGGDHVLTGLSPGSDDAVDRLGCEIGAVGEDDDRSLGLGGKCLEAAAKRGAGAALPLRTVDRPGTRLELVCTDDDDDPVDRAASNPLQHRLEQDPLLG